MLGLIWVPAADFCANARDCWSAFPSALPTIAISAIPGLLCGLGRHLHKLYRLLRPLLAPTLGTGSTQAQYNNAGLCLGPLLLLLIICSTWRNLWKPCFWIYSVLSVHQLAPLWLCRSVSLFKNKNFFSWQSQILGTFFQHSFEHPVSKQHHKHLPAPSLFPDPDLWEVSVIDV